jgi:hypothetical protein
MGVALGPQHRPAHLHFDCGTCDATIFRDADARGWSRVVIAVLAAGLTGSNDLRRRNSDADSVAVVGGFAIFETDCQTQLTQVLIEIRVFISPGKVRHKIG